MGKYDKWILIATVLLVGFGALMIYSTTSVITPRFAQKGVTEFFYFKRHIFTIIIGFSFMLIAFRMQPSFIKKMAVPLLIVSFLLLVLVGVYLVGANCELWCPFGGVEALCTYVADGDMLCSLGTANFFILGGVLLMTLLLRRAFCGYMCPIGTISEWLGLPRETAGARY